MNAKETDEELAAGIVLSAARRFASRGTHETPHGVRLFGPTPHIAPKAWFHAVPRGTTDRAMRDFVATSHLHIPPTYGRFLKIINGAHLFGDELALFGIRPAAGRTIDSAFLPYDIRDPNGLERPTWVQSPWCVIGSYQRAGSLIVMNCETDTVERRALRSGRCSGRWLSFLDFVRAELARLDLRFTDDAKPAATTKGQPRGATTSSERRSSRLRR